MDGRRFGFGAGVLKSTDSGGTWTATNAGLRSLQVGDLAVDPQTPATLYATSNGVFKSTNAGGTWAAAGAGLPSGSASALVIDPKTPATLYAGTSSGVFKSTDAGATWVPLTNDLPPGEITALYVDHLGDIWLGLQMQNDLPGRRDGLWRSDDQGVIWREVSLDRADLLIQPGLADIDLWDFRRAAVAIAAGYAAARTALAQWPD